MRWVQRLLDPLLVRLEADHLLRDPLDHITREPFVVERWSAAASVTLNAALLAGNQSAWLEFDGLGYGSLS